MRTLRWLAQAAQDLAADGLSLRFDPLQADLVRLFEPDMPLRGTFAGRARLDGPMTGRFMASTAMSIVP